MLSQALAWVACTAIVSGTFALCYFRWLSVQPACTADEFARVVKQLNQLTMDLAEMKSTTDSVRSAVAMSRIGSSR